MWCWLSNHTQHCTAQAYSEPRSYVDRVRVSEGERSGSGDGYGYGHGGGRVHGEATLLFGSFGSAESSSLRIYCSTSSTAARLIVGRCLTKPANLHQDAPKTSNRRSQPCSVVVEVFFGPGNHVEVASDHPTPLVECHGSRWKSSSVAVAEQKPPSPIPAGRELTAGSLGKSRVHTAAKDPEFSPPRVPRYLAPSGPGLNGKVQQRNLSLGPRWPRHVCRFDAPPGVHQ